MHDSDHDAGAPGRSPFQGIPPCPGAGQVHVWFIPPTLNEQVLHSGWPVGGRICCHPRDCWFCTGFIVAQMLHRPSEEGSDSGLLPKEIIPMEKHPLDLLEYYEHQIRAAAQATASVALLQDADRLLERIKKATCGCSSIMD